MWLRLALLVPKLLLTLIPVVEALRGPGGGSQKAEAVKTIVATMIEAVEGATGRDLFNDPEIQRLTQAVIDAQVALSNALARRGSSTSPAAGGP